MGNLLRCLTKEHGSSWDSVIAQAKFTYNDSVNRTTGLSPFQIVYGTHPRGVMEVRDVKSMERTSAQASDFVEVIKEIHQEVKDRLEKVTMKYKEATYTKRRDLQFEIGDLVMVNLKKERLPKGKFTKLMMRKIGPFKILQKCGHNA